MKDGFIIHISDADLFEDLSDSEVGMILRTMIAHAKGEEVEEFSDRTMKTVLRKLIVHMDFDAAKYKATCQRRAEAINSRWEKYKSIQMNTNEYKSIQVDTNDTDNDNDNENDNVNENENVNDNENDKYYLNPYMSGRPDEGGKKKTKKSDHADERAEVIGYLNLKSGKSFKADSASAIRFINGRLKDGYTVEDMKHVVDVKVAEWKDTERDQYLRPVTLFSSTKFESYLNQRPVKPKKNVFSLSDSMKHGYDLKELVRRAKAE